MNDCPTNQQARDPKDFEFRIIQDMSRSHGADPAVEEYIQLRENAYVKDGLPKMDSKHIVPGTTFIVLTDKKKNKVIGGVHLVTKSKGMTNRLPFENDGERPVEEMLPGIDRKNSCYCQIGGVAVLQDDEYALLHLGTKLQQMAAEEGTRMGGEFCVSTLAARNYITTRAMLRAGKVHLPLQEMDPRTSQNYIKVLDVRTIPGEHGEQIPVVDACFTGPASSVQTRSIFHKSCEANEHQALEKAAYDTFKAARDKDAKTNPDVEARRARFRRGDTVKPADEFNSYTPTEITNAAQLLPDMHPPSKLKALLENKSTLDPASLRNPSTPSRSK